MKINLKKYFSIRCRSTAFSTLLVLFSLISAITVTVFASPAPVHAQATLLRSLVSQDADSWSLCPPDVEYTIIENPLFQNSPQTLWCDSEKHLRLIIYFLASTQKPALQIEFDSLGRKVRQVQVDSESILRDDFDRIYNDNTTFTEKIYCLKPESHTHNARLDKVKVGLPTNDSRVSHYSEVTQYNCETLTNEPQWTDIFQEVTNSSEKIFMQPKQRWAYNQQGILTEKYLFRFQRAMPENNLVESITRLDADGQQIGYFSIRGADAQEIHQKSSHHENTRVQRQKRMNSKTQETVLVIDSGLDLRQDLLYFHLDTKDSQQSEQLRWDGGPGDLIPFSHGSHVAAAAMVDINQFKVKMIAGDFLYKHMQKARDFLRDNSVRFINASFSLLADLDPDSPMSRARDELYAMMKEHPETLMFAAAGNHEGMDLDKASNDIYPATMPLKNKIVIAALDTATLQRTQLQTLKLVDFSNRGKYVVDIAAPGVNIYSAGLANTFVKASGTSMATPWVMNIAMRMSEINPALGSLDIKSILMKTAYVQSLTSPLLVRSGGFVLPERALLAAQIMKDHPKLNTEEASLRAHQQIVYPQEREGASLDELVSFWRDRYM